VNAVRNRPERAKAPDTATLLIFILLLFYCFAELDSLKATIGTKHDTPSMTMSDFFGLKTPKTTCETGKKRLEGILMDIMDGCGCD
jgi:hypothetical protein